VSPPAAVSRTERLQLLALVLAAALFRLALLTLPRLVRWDEPISTTCRSTRCSPGSPMC
jgi:hypothetical protein